MNQKTIKLFKDYLKVDENLKDTRFCWHTKEQNRGVFLKKDPLKVLKKIYKELSNSEKILFKKALQEKMVYLLSKKEGELND